MSISGDGWDIVSAREAVGPVGGLGGRDQRSSAWQQGVKRHDIVSTRRKLPINVKNRVGITGGAVFGATSDYASATVGKGQGTGYNARKRAARKAAGRA